MRLLRKLSLDGEFRIPLVATVAGITVAVIIVLCSESRDTEWRPIDRRVDALWIALSGSRPDNNGPSRELDSIHDIAQDAMKDLRDAYVASADKLDTNIKLQATVLLVGLIVLMGRKLHPNIKSGREANANADVGSNEAGASFLEFNGVRIGLELFHLVLPVIGVWLWLQFGFMLSAAIDQRATLDQLIRARTSAPGAEYAVFSERLSLIDAGFVDLWFNAWRDDHVFADSEQFGQRSRKVASWLTVGFQNIMIGLTHAVLLALALDGQRVFRRKHTSVLRLACSTLFWVLLFIFIISHLLFRLGGQHPNYAQIVIGASGAVLLLLLLIDLGSTHETRVP